MKNTAEAHRTLRYLLRRAADALSLRVYGQLGSLGFADVRVAHSAVFRTIAPGGSRVGDMAAAAQMAKQSMSYLVGTLDMAGYVEIVPDPGDRRAKLVRLTRRGQELSDTLIVLGARLEGELAARLGRGEIRRLREILEGMIGHFEGEEAGRVSG